MTTLLLDVTNKRLINTLRSIKNNELILSSFSYPKLYPFPQFVIVDFTITIKSNDNETTLTEIIKHIVPHPYVVACMSNWKQEQIHLAKIFGINRIVQYNNEDDLMNLSELIIKRNN